jgi:hypothetical protein
MKKVLMAVAVVALAGSGFAQGSPRGKASVSVGGKQVTVDYGRPALKGRPLGDLLKQLEADRMWRAGSEQVTTLHTEADLLVGDKKVPAGKYSLYLHAPESGPYALAINKDPGVPLGQIWDKAPANLKNELWPRMSYGPIVEQELARVTLQSDAPAAPADQFTIALSPSKDGAVLSLAWGDKAWKVAVKPAK